MKFVGLAVVRNEEDIVEAFVRHNLHFLDRLYLVDDGSTDATRRILDLLAGEGLRIVLLNDTLTVTPGADDPMTRMFRHALAQEGAGAYFPLDADEFFLLDENMSLDRLKAALLAIDGNATVPALRLCVVASDTGGTAYGADVLRQFRFIENPHEVRRIGSADARKIVLKVADPDRAALASLAQGSPRLTDGGPTGGGFAAADAPSVCYAFAPVRSPGQLVKKALGALVGRAARHSGIAAAVTPPIQYLLNLLRTKDLTAEDLWPASLAWVTTAENGSIQLRQGDLSGLFHYDLKYTDARTPLLGSLASDIAGTVGAMWERLHASEDAGLLARLRAMIETGDLAEARRTLEERLGTGTTDAVMELYFDVIERMGAKDVPSSILTQAASLSAHVRESIGQLPDGRLLLPYLEMDISYACNLRCDGCSHYSNYAMSGVVRVDDARAWMAEWSTRLFPRRFRLLGGEPAINPDAAKIISAAAEIFPQSMRSLVSNGLLLHKRSDIMQALAETGTGLCLSMHDRTEETRASLIKVDQWARDLGIQCMVIKAYPEDFNHLYRGAGRDIQPFDDEQPFSSWACCGEKNCACIHEGLLWKCPPLAFLNLLDKKISLSERPEWTRYLAHRGRPATASNEDLYAYLAYPERDCAMCPAKRPAS